MGLLKIDNVLEWGDIILIRDELKRRGVKQFLKVFNFASDYEVDFLWGDEIEVMIVSQVSFCKLHDSKVNNVTIEGEKAVFKITSADTSFCNNMTTTTTSSSNKKDDAPNNINVTSNSKDDNINSSVTIDRKDINIKSDEKNNKFDSNFNINVTSNSKDDNINGFVAKNNVTDITNRENVGMMNHIKEKTMNGLVVSNNNSIEMTSNIIDSTADSNIYKSTISKNTNNDMPKKNIKNTDNSGVIDNNKNGNKIDNNRVNDNSIDNDINNYRNNSFTENFINNNSTINDNNDVKSGIEYKNGSIISMGECTCGKPSTRLLLCGEKILEQYPSTAQTVLTPEFAGYMIETTPGHPHSSNLCNMTTIEKCMDRRLTEMNMMVGTLGGFIGMITCFGKLGAYKSFYDIDSNGLLKEISERGRNLTYDITKSNIFPDNAINKHKRFYSFVRNIINRRGRKVEGYIRIMESTKKIKSVNRDISDNINSNQEISNKYNSESGINKTNPNDNTTIKMNNVDSSYEKKDDKHPGDYKINDPITINGFRHVLIDSMGQGMGCSCLQVTLQPPTHDQARLIYDMLGSICPVFLRLTRATPLCQGRLLNTETRWDMLSFSVDCRTDKERGAPYNISGEYNEIDYAIIDQNVPKTEFIDLDEYYKEKKDLRNNLMNSDRYYRQKMNGNIEVPKSRFSSIDLYISNDQCNLDMYNDIKVPIHEESLEYLINNGVDKRMARHVASLFVRDPVLVYENDDYKEILKKIKGKISIDEGYNNGKNEVIEDENNNKNDIIETNKKSKIYINESDNNGKNDIIEVDNNNKNDIIESNKKSKTYINEDINNGKNDIIEVNINNKNDIIESNKKSKTYINEGRNDNTKSKNNFNNIGLNSDIEENSFESANNTNYKEGFFTEDFENLQSSNWRSMRFKLPQISSKTKQNGWKVEIRPMEIQPTAFENAAWSIFTVILAKAILKYKINLYIPISMVDENFRRSNLCYNKIEEYYIKNKKKFKTPKDKIMIYYRTNIYDKGPAKIKIGTMEDVMNGSGEYEGLIGIVEKYIKEETIELIKELEKNDNDKENIEDKKNYSDDHYKKMSEEESKKLKTHKTKKIRKIEKKLEKYIEFIKGRTTGKYMAVSDWMRHEIINYRNGINEDFLVSEENIDNLILKIKKISEDNNIEYLKNKY